MPLQYFYCPAIPNCFTHCFRFNYSIPPQISLFSNNFIYCFKYGISFACLKPSPPIKFSCNPDTLSLLLCARILIIVLNSFHIALTTKHQSVWRFIACNTFYTQLNIMATSSSFGSTGEDHNYPLAVFI